MNGAGPEERFAGTARRARGRWPWILVGAAAVVVVLVPALASGGGSGGGGSGGGPAGSSGGGNESAGSSAASGAAAACPMPAKPLRYPEVQPIFEQHCAKCHDARKSKNDAAQAVFEMTSYPFATRRPATLLGDLQAMLPKRGALSAEEKCRGVQWLTAGALDATGSPPHWR